MVLRIFKVTTIIALVVFSVAFFISVKSLLSFPFNLVNVVFIVLTFLLFFSQPVYTLWYSFTVGFILELYALTPFGVLLSSFLLSVMVGSYAYDRLFTNFSFLSLLALLCVVVVVHRALSLGLAFVFGGPLGTTFGFEVIHLFWELLLNGLVLLLVFGCIRILYRRARPEFLRN